MEPAARPIGAMEPAGPSGPPAPGTPPAGPAAPVALDSAPPGHPIPRSLAIALLEPTPADASRFEAARDAALRRFAGATVSRVFAGLAAVLLVALVVFGALIAWAVLGLFLGVPNGWDAPSPRCRAAAAAANVTLGARDVPRVAGAYVAGACTANQRWFNLCVKAFVGLFCYVHFLPIPWRVAVAAHAFGRARPSGPGVDFYGRPTTALWFWIPRPTRRWIAVLLNLAWLLHFVCVAMHCVWRTYIESQTWPGALLQNLPFGLSIACQCAAGAAQARAERRLTAAHPRRFPPGLARATREAYGRWRAGATDGGLWRTLSGEFSGERVAAAMTGIEGTPSKRRSAAACAAAVAGAYSSPPAPLGAARADAHASAAADSGITAAHAPKQLDAVLADAHATAESPRPVPQVPSPGDGPGTAPECPVETSAVSCIPLRGPSPPRARGGSPPPHDRGPAPEVVGGGAEPCLTRVAPP